MAGDWIKMRTDLDTDPAVLGIAADLDIPETQVVGCLHKLWVWFTNHTKDGNAPSVTPVTLDRITSVAGFSESVARHGWLVFNESDNGDGKCSKVGCSIPAFDMHMSQGAKTRALTALRVAKSRAKTCNAPSVTPSLPEKRREEIREKTTSSPVRSPRDRDSGPTSEPPAGVRWSPETGWVGVTDEDRDRWAKAYPQVDVGNALDAMDAWLRANPAKSRKKLWAKFVTGWLNRDQRDAVTPKPQARSRFDETVDRSAFERQIARANGEAGHA